MKRAASLTLFLLILSILSGTLLASASWVGKVGIDMFYQEYTFLKIWWQGASLIFLVLMFLYALQSFAQKKLSVGAAKIVHIFAILAALCGLYFTYSDFRNDFSHRLLGERFHIGAYLFWIGWISVSVYLLFTKENNKAAKEKYRYADVTKRV